MRGLGCWKPQIDVHFSSKEEYTIEVQTESPCWMSLSISPVTTVESWPAEKWRQHWRVLKSTKNQDDDVLWESVETLVLTKSLDVETLVLTGQRDQTYNSIWARCQWVSDKVFFWRCLHSWKVRGEDLSPQLHYGLSSCYRYRLSVGQSVRSFLTQLFPDT